MSKSHEAPLKKHLNRMLVENPIRFTLGVILASFGLLLVTTWVVYEMFGPGRGRANSGTELISAFSSLLQGTLGSALSLGGTIATITLAVLAYRMVLLQERRERDGVAREFLAQGIHPLADLAQSLNQLLFVSLRFRQDWIVARNGTQPISMLTGYEYWMEHQREFCDVLERLTADLEEASKSLVGNALMQFGEHGIRSGPEPGLLRKVRGAESLFTVNPLSTWAQLLRERVRILRSWSQKEVVENLGLAHELTEMQIAHLRDRNVETPMARIALLFGGNLLWRVVSQDGQVASSPGCALLLDLAGAIPTQHEILEVLDEHFYPDEDLPLRIKTLVSLISVTSVLWKDLEQERDYFAIDQNWMVLTIECNPDRTASAVSAEMG